MGLRYSTKIGVLRYVSLYCGLICVHTFKKILLVLTALIVYINACAQLNADFTSNTRQGCSPLIVSFKDSSQGNPTQWLWDLGNGAISTERHPSAIYFSPGNYTVKLYIRDSTGAVDSMVKTDYVTVFENPLVDFGATPEEGCAPLSVQFTDFSVARSGNVAEWTWDFGDGVTSPLQNPTHTYNISDSFNVSLTVTNSYGCKRTLEKPAFVKIKPSPTAGFTYVYDNICKAPTLVTFLNASQSVEPVSYQWLFGDGQGSTERNPAHVYLANGDFDVTLIVTNTVGCSDTSIQSISIGSAKADFSYTDFCLNSPVTFTDASTAQPLKQVWDFGDGTKDSGAVVTHSYASGGPFLVTLTADFGGCTDVATKRITAVKRPTANFGVQGKVNTCIYPFTVQFVNASQDAVSYQWIFGDGTTSSDQNPIHIYTLPGKYSVTLIAYGSNGCADTLEKNELIKIGSPQIKKIGNTPFKGCAPQAFTFEPTIDLVENVTAYYWDFGDGGNSNAPTPTHLYNDPGTYDVTLIVRTIEGCADTLRVVGAVSIGVAPTANFSADPLNTCAEVPVQFTDASTGDISTWRWFFGDGTSSGDQNPSHQYIDTGYFDVRLIVGQNECYDTLVKRRYVYILPPVARFTLNDKCADPYTYYFTDKSKGAKTWDWNFGDGTTIAGKNQVHTYTSPGFYIISLTVTNGSCSYTAYDSLIVVDEKPSYKFENLTTNNCKYDSVRFTATDYNPDNVASFEWYYGDGTRSDESKDNNIVYHYYKNAGTYTPYLVMTDINGCSDTIKNNLQIQVYGPKAAFSNKDGDCVFATVDFTDESVSDGVHPIKTWIWDYGDGTIPDTLTAPPFSHTYSINGLFDVTLKVIDESGCYDTAINRDLFIGKPTAGFYTKDTLSCAGSPVNFIDSSSGGSLTYAWNFGDGQTATDSDPTHSYSADGSYDIKLVVTDDFGCKDSATRPAYVRIASPVAGFTLMDTLFSCPPGKINPVNTSINYTSFIWDFGDGNVSTEPSPEHYYTQAGVFTLKLSISGYGSCYDTFTKAISLKGPIAKLSYSPDVGCNPVDVAFVTEAQNTSKFIWDYGNGVVQITTVGNTNYTYTSPGKFLPKLIVVDSVGCQVPVLSNDTIIVSAAQAQFTALRKPGYCDSSLYEFTDMSNLVYDTIIAYNWQFGDGGSSIDPHPLHYYNKIGLYNATLQIITKHGCQGSYTLPVNVLIDTTPDVFATVPGRTCANAAIPLSAGVANDSPGNYTWLWDLGNGDQLTIYDTSYTYSQPGSYNVVVKATSAAGCSGTAVNVIVVDPSPPTDAGADIVICKGESVTLTATGADTYQWMADPSLSCLRCANPVASPLFNTTYFVTGANSFGCAVNDSVTVSVKQPANVSVEAPDTICVGTTITLKATGAELFQWEPASLVTNATDSVTNSTPSSSTTYTVVGTDTKGCFSDTASVFVNVFPIPAIQLTDSAVQISVGDQYQINATGSADITRWQWLPPIYISCTDCPNPVVSPKHTETYTVTASNVAGCKSQESITILVSCKKDQNIFIPNTFSPNGDGMNDYFYPRGKGLSNIKSFRVFNRWGNIVYQRTNFPANQQSYGWDGNYNGKALQSDVYVFVIEISCENGQTLSSKGNVTLLR